MTDSLTALIEKELAGQTADFSREYIELTDAMRYSLLSGGKRIRPRILMLFYRLCGGKNEAALPFAAGLEMIHTYSLIHDDLPCMDDDDMRRGRPSCHKAYGETTALLAGDALLTLGFAAAAKTTGLPAERVTRAIAVLAERAGMAGMVGGQVMDLRFERETPSLAELHNMVEKKTACLIMAAAEIGCILAGAPEEQVAAAREYGFKTGLAFQIIDDILDYAADEAVLGKPTGSDAKNGKTTFVTLLGMEGARREAKDLTNRALAALDRFDGDHTELAELTRHLLVREY